MAKLKVGDRILDNDGDVHEILSVHGGSRVFYWVIQSDRDHAIPMTYDYAIEGWEKAPDFFEVGHTYKTSRDEAIAYIKYVEEVDGRKYAFAIATDFTGKSRGIMLQEMHFNLWSKR